MRVSPFLGSYTRLTRYSARSPGHGFVSSECHPQLHAKSHARAGLMFSIKALCNPSTPDFPGAPSSQPLSHSIENLLTFTIITAMIFTASSASLARDSDANQKGLGAWSNAPDRRYTIGTTGARLWFEWYSAQQRMEAGKVAKARSTQRIFALSFGE